MATVTKEFKENYEFWIADRIASGAFTEDEAEALRVMIRKDLMPGPDQLREGVTLINQAGIEVPGMIDSSDERYALWDAFFAAECAEIRCMAVGANARIRARVEADREKAKEEEKRKAA